MRFLIVNKAKGARIVRTVDKGVRTLQPGRQITAEVNDAHLAWLEGAGLSLEPVDDAEATDEPTEAPEPAVEAPAASVTPDSPAAPPKAKARRKRAD
jgi:hypothetical protein